MLEAANLTGLDSTDWTWSIKFGDLDSDGRVDVFVTNGVGKNMNDSDAGREYKRLMDAGKTDEARDQLLRMPPLKEENLAFRNLGDLAFEKASHRWGANHLGVSQGASVVDLDRDGDLDLLVNNMNEPMSVYRNEINQGHQLLVRLRGTQSNRFGLDARIVVSAGGVEFVRYVTSARGFMSADDPVTHFGLGEQSRIDHITVQWPSGIQQRFTNFAADQLVTITEGEAGQFSNPETVATPPLFSDASSSVLSAPHREMAYDDFQDQPLLPNKLSQLGPGLAWGDVNGDGLQDCYIGAATGGLSQLVLQSSPGQFREGMTFSETRSFEDMGAVFVDMDADGDLDLYVVSGGYEREADSEYLQDRLYWNDGSGNFQRAAAGVVPEIRLSGSSVSAADFDRDGDLDLFVGTRLTPRQWPLPASSQLLENRDGRLVEVATELAPALQDLGLVTGSVWSDVDQDGWIDLLVSLEWGPIKLLKNQQGKLVDATQQAGLADQRGWWNSINSGDFDHDGDMDFVAMNFGLNTKYHADDQHPVVLFANDFDNNGTLDLVEAEYEGDVCYPIRGRSCSSHAMPFLKEKFPTYHEFALADVQEIYSDQSLEQSHRFAANQLQSVLLVNDGKGHFRITPLPRIVQISPGFGSVLQDFNGDGHLDLCIAQNFMQPQPETGQMDGGLSVLLLGDGQGGFDFQTPAESGISVPGQGMALTTVDLNQDAAPDLVMTVNDEPSRVWFNQADTSRQWVEIALQAEAGNPAAVGSLVWVQTGKTRQAHEITAGAGYLSQSAAKIYVAVDKNDPITEIQVRWPDGTTQLHPGEASSPRILIQKQNPGRTHSN